LLLLQSSKRSTEKNQNIRKATNWRELSKWRICVED
jgi:hypothetical protein